MDDDKREQIERELDLFFFVGGGEDSDADAARGARSRTLEKIFQILDQGLEAARKQITATVMVDFPFCDCHGRGCAPGACALLPEEEHLAFDKADGLTDNDLYWYTVL